LKSYIFQVNNFQVNNYLLLCVTCGSGPLRCMAVTSLNLLSEIYLTFEDLILGLGKYNNWTDWQCKRLDQKSTL